MFRKILSCLLLSLLILSCAGCGATETSPTTSDSEDGLFPVETDSALGSSDSEQTSSGSTERVTVEDVFAASDHYVGLTDQLNGRIIVCDLEVEDWTDDQAVVWEYKNPSFKNVAGIKFRDSEYYGEKVVLLCYSGGASIISYETREILFTTNDVGWNPHSVELLPNGVFLVASSTDNRVDVFAPENAKSKHTFEFPNAHGVLWDPEYEVLWLVGTDLLAAYTMQGTAEDPSCIPIGGMEYRTPKSGMHDLAPVYGDPTALFVTCGSGIMKFNKETETFGFSYRGGTWGKAQEYAPGVGNFEDGVFVFTTIKEGKTVHQEWNTNEVCFYVPLDDIRARNLTRKAPGDAYYKVRVLNFDYQ